MLLYGPHICPRHFQLWFDFEWSYCNWPTNATNVGSKVTASRTLEEVYVSLARRMFDGPHAKDMAPPREPFGMRLRSLKSRDDAD